MLPSPPNTLPPASNGGPTVCVKLIDTGSRVGDFDPTYLLKPRVPGFNRMKSIPAWSFLIEHDSTGQKALFDLSIPTDWKKDLGPAYAKEIANVDWTVNTPRNVLDVLKEHGMDGSEIGSIIWSHWHWDHIGNTDVFPSTTELVVGPGFKEAFMPGYPTNPDALLHEKDFKGRSVREIDFSSDNNNNNYYYYHARHLGQLRAFDFFGDGSFYLLDTPGHAVGHLGGLARTTSSPDTYVFMGGDLSHHGGAIRPSRYLPVPQSISPHPWRQQQQQSSSAAGCSPCSLCPGTTLQELQRTRDRRADEPFFDPVITDSFEEAVETIKKAQEFDANDNVLFIAAHDDVPVGVVDLFPADVNEWKKKGWREKMLWAFLRDFRAYLEGDAEQKA